MVQKLHKCPKKANWQRDRPIHRQVGQFGVMTDYEIVTLTQHGAVDFKTIAVFLFQSSTDIRYFSRSKLDAVCTAVYQETDKLYKKHHYVHHHRRQLRALVAWEKLILSYRVFHAFWSLKNRHSFSPRKVFSILTKGLNWSWSAVFLCHQFFVSAFFSLGATGVLR